jgi:hypothetical protein
MTKALALFDASTVALIGSTERSRFEAAPSSQRGRFG